MRSRVSKERIFYFSIPRGKNNDKIQHFNSVVFEKDDPLKTHGNFVGYRRKIEITKFLLSESRSRSEMDGVHGRSNENRLINEVTRAR